MPAWIMHITVTQAGAGLLLGGCLWLGWGLAGVTNSDTHGITRIWARLIVGVMLCIAGLALLTVHPGGGS
jgi:hypothetical protein